MDLEKELFKNVQALITLILNEAKSYAKTFMYKGKFFEIILMCRVNPYKVRIASLVNDLESWIVNGDELNDPNGKKYDDEVRINRILLHIHDNN